MTGVFELNKNSFTGVVTSQLGQLTKMNNHFSLSSNSFCSDVPTEVRALSSGISDWYVASGNNIGTPCWQFTSNGDFIPTAATSVEYKNTKLTGTIPTQVRRDLVHGN